MAVDQVTREQQVIEAARANRAEIDRLEVERLQLAVEWVLVHPGAEVDTSIAWGMRDLEIADALALEEYVSAKAATLDPELPLDVRRSMASACWVTVRVRGCSGRSPASGSSGPTPRPTTYQLTTTPPTTAGGATTVPGYFCRW